MQSADAAEAEFYAAFAATDLPRMRAVWADSPDCLCVHPAGVPIAGYAAVMASWQDILGSASPIDLHCERVARLVGEDTVVSTVYEHFVPPGMQGELAPVLATNIYRRVDGQWKIVVHHASPVVMRPPAASEISNTRH